MSSDYKQSKDELQQHLKDTVQALELSSHAFDDGYEGEAKRCAAAIRVLVHDTSYSKSLLNQLGLKQASFYDTSVPYNPKTVITYSGLTAINITLEGSVHIAPLDGLPPGHTPKWVSFDEWWDGLIFVDKGGIRTSRKDLILAVANKDGGTHVDPVLDEKYANLSRFNSLAWRFSSPKGDVQLAGPEKAAIRQISHEILKSLNPKMPEIKPAIKGAMFMGATAVVEEKTPIIPKVGRNEQCPCGSGKKYKWCHGR